MRIRIILSFLFAAAMLFLPTASFAQVGVSVRIGPPPLPVYEQPSCPGDGYIWTPGYWGWSDGDYYWVPGTWVVAPEPGFLWTPAYWGWSGRGFVFNEGYWGHSVGFYGGIDYGFGYFGHGYEGGRWENGHFFYNTRLNNVNVNMHNVYNTSVNRPGGDRVSYNGGNGGINARATAQEEAAGHDRHIRSAAPQTQHALAARDDPQQRFSANHGAPPVAATPEPGAFRDGAVVPARQSPAAAVHPRELPLIVRPASPNSGNPNLDQKYQRQQENLIAKQNQDRQKLQQTQDREHQQLTRQQADQGRTQQVEQRHQQRTQQLQQRQTQQIQQMQQRQQPRGGGGSRGGGGERR